VAVAKPAANRFLTGKGRPKEKVWNGAANDGRRTVGQTSQTVTLADTERTDRIVVCILSCPRARLEAFGG
jgi:hypothetical protein